MAKYYALVFLAVTLVVGRIFVGLGETHPYREASTAPKVPHAYDDAESPIKDIRITAYYFVPSNKTTDAGDMSWKIPLAVALEQLQSFHELQLSNTSHISYTIHPDTIIGEQSNAFYDTDDTAHGNPNALKRITAELAKHGQAAGGTNDTYQVTYIIYDGVGAVGMRDGDIHAALLNRRFLMDPAYHDIRETLFAHEFYHTIGIPDGYNLTTGTSTTADLMGLGRSVRPLKYNFIDQDTLIRLGL